MTEEVAELVLRDNYDQTQALEPCRRLGPRNWFISTPVQPVSWKEQVASIPAWNFFRMKKGLPNASRLVKACADRNLPYCSPTANYQPTKCCSNRTCPRTLFPVR
ncbi:MAG: hypothetical protein CM1200mP20_01590 [Pseudomonadota bacterium]|nr:MAG: hypothetical protein CM1200mP20_01590 [Pseudomonadota bacterium]